VASATLHSESTHAVHAGFAATGVCVHHGATVALAPTDLEVGPGTVVALVGSNGSGKTTLLHLVAGLLEPTAGSIDVIGRVALVAQHQAHHPWMPLSVDEVLRMGRYRGLVHRLGRADRDEIDRAAERLEVAHLRRRAYGALSGGERQRVLVAKAVASGADLLLLDEPITGLDLPSQGRILEVIDEHARSGGTVVFSTHHLGEASRADRVVLMAGCVLADGRPEEVLVPELLAEAFGGRMVLGDGTAVVVDEHHHDHETPFVAADLAAHLDHHGHHHEHPHHDGPTGGRE
jgi:ABC-type Mn2+/Zn2+ transport system ATPase subunit